MGSDFDRRTPGSSFSNSRFAGLSPEEYPFPLPPPIEQQNIAALFYSIADEKRHQCFGRTRDTETDEWIIHSWLDAASAAARLTRFLIEDLGVKAGDRVAIASGTRYEWALADFAILSAGAISVPLYQTLPAAEAGYILWDTAAKVVFVENQEQLEKIAALEQSGVEIPPTEKFEGGRAELAFSALISFEECSLPPLGKRLLRLETLVAGAGQEDLDYARVAAEKARRDDLASIVYTSGTTGPAKGVVQTHANHLAMLDSVVLSGIVGSGRATLMFLPLAHSFARLILYVVTAVGGDFVFPKIVSRTQSRFEASQILLDMRLAEPLIVPTVPRLFEKIRDGLLGEGKTLRERVAVWAIRTYLEMLPRAAELNKDNSRAGIRLRLRFILAELVIKQVKRQLFGSRFRYAVSGGAPLDPELAQFFKSLGAHILEGYGLTETTPALAVNTTEHWKIGTVGRLFENIELKIADDGEILVRGPNIAKGYWDRPKATAEAWLADGWFAKGDIGEIDEEGFLRITDRKKDLIVNAGGKKTPPAPLEIRLRSSPYISHAFLYGDRKPYLVALITLNPDAIRSWAAEKNIPFEGKSPEALASLPEVRALIQAEVDSLNKTLAQYDQIKRFKILAEDFTLENQLLTAALKVKRKAVAERYKEEIEELYRGA